MKKYIISLAKFNLPLYVTHSSRALQSHDLSGEGTELLITYVLFWPHEDMEGLPEWGSEHEKMFITAKWYSGTLWA